MKIQDNKNNSTNEDIVQEDTVQEDTVQEDTKYGDKKLTINELLVIAKKFDKIRVYRNKKSKQNYIKNKDKRKAAYKLDKIERGVMPAKTLTNSLTKEELINRANQMKRDWYKANRESQLLKKKQWYKENKEVKKQWYQDNKDKIIANNKLDRINRGILPFKSLKDTLTSEEFIKYKKKKKRDWYLANRESQLLKKKNAYKSKKNNDNNL